MDLHRVLLKKKTQQHWSPSPRKTCFKWLQPGTKESQETGFLISTLLLSVSRQVLA